MINSISNFENPEIIKKSFELPRVNQKQYFNAQDSYSSNTQNEKNNKKKLPTWAKLIITWSLADIVTDLIIDVDAKKAEKFNILRPFSWIVRKFKK